MSQVQPSRIDALNIIESLRKGLPPEYGVQHYSVGYEKLIEGVNRHHLSLLEHSGKIRFVSGSWGAGKTHFFRLIREAAAQQSICVATVQLTKEESPLNKFERVFYAMIRQITTPLYQNKHDHTLEINLFDRVLQEALAFLAKGDHQPLTEVNYPDFDVAQKALFADSGIDIDFKTIIRLYWETFLATNEQEPVALQEKRARLIQWFSGEGKLPDFRKNFGVSKLIDKTNAKLMLHSLASFVRLAGYKGLVILFDEAEQSYSVMRRSALKDAQNNLLTLINSISEIAGLLLIYATTPDFYTDDKYGIKIYGALASRIGQPQNTSPRALDTVWNLDTIQLDVEVYKQVAIKVLHIYRIAEPEYSEQLPDETEIRAFIGDLHTEHPQLSAVRFWRVMMASLIRKLDNTLDGIEETTEEIYYDRMRMMRED
jgi:hypothetical protein